MANKDIFKSAGGTSVPATDTVNEAGGTAYSTGPKHSLAQYAVTGCFGQTYYTTAQDQLEAVLGFAKAVDPKFIAQVAVYSRKKGHMKDMPALLAAVLAGGGHTELLKKIFPIVIDNGKMLRNFVQIMRSGVVGRRSLGTRPKKLVQAWFNDRNDEAIFRNSIGSNPSMSDVIKMVHPRPSNKQRKALYAYMIGKPFEMNDLPPLVKAYEDYKNGVDKSKVPDVPFQFLASLDLGKKEWTEIARNAPWQMTRMNLNTFTRHGVFEDKAMLQLVADRLVNEDLIKKSRVFPYQLMTAFMSADVDIKLKNALQTAMDAAIANVPAFDGKVYVFPDTSGSMSYPVTGYGGSSRHTSVVKCIDVAGLVAATVMQRNPEAEVIPFATTAYDAKLNPRDSVMTNAVALARMGGGGTNCSAPLEKLNSAGAKGDLLIYVSDNESWIDSSGTTRWYNDGTKTMAEWKKFKKRNPKAKMVCIDIMPNSHTQAPNDKDILNVGGFSDTVFDVIKQFASSDSHQWVKLIEGIDI